MKEHVALVLKNESGEILFVQRSLQKKSLPGAWSFPSGTVEEGETVYETAVREAEEELGVSVKPEEIFAEKELSEVSVKLVFLLCSIKSGEVSIKQPEEIAQLSWLKFNEFFDAFADNQIGHGLIWLRKNPEVWKNIS